MALQKQTLLINNCCRFMGKKMLEFVDFFMLPPKSSLQGFSSPPSGRSMEYLLPVTIQLMVASLNINNDKICDNCLGKWPTITLSFKTATAYISLEFDGKQEVC